MIPMQMRPVKKVLFREMTGGVGRFEHLISEVEPKAILTSSNSHHNSERATREFSPSTVTTRRLTFRRNNSRSYLHALE